MRNASRNEVAPVRWRLDRQIWLRIAWNTLGWWGLMLFPLVLAEKWSEWRMRVFLSLVMFVPYGLMAYLEKRRRSPVPRFWIIEDEFKLTIRSLTTGEILLQASQGKLSNQDLRDISLPNANLQGVDLSSTDLRGANLRGAHLRGALLISTDLSSADLRNADLGVLTISKADFRNADLRGTNFRGWGATTVIWDTKLGDAEFTGAKYNRATRWPLGFDPQSRGCILYEDAEAILPIPSRLNHPSGTSRTLPRPSAAYRVEEEDAQNQLRPSG